MSVLFTAFRSLSERKLRSFLTMLGVIIGVASIYSLLAIGMGTRNQILSTFDDQSARTVMLSPRGDNSIEGKYVAPKPFADSDLALLASLPGVEAVSGEVVGSLNVVARNADAKITITGSDSSYLLTSALTLDAGRDLTAADLRLGLTPAVIGTAASVRLFDDNYPVGEDIRIGGTYFQIVGLVEAFESLSGRDETDLILIPRTTARNRLFGHSRSVKNQVDTITVLVREGASVSAVRENIDTILRNVRALQADAEPSYRQFNSSDILEQVATVGLVFTVLLGSIGSISLLVGGIGVMNIMLVSVSERTPEIGLRMSLGARRSDILRQFLTEAIVLCGLGGLVGLLAGYGLASLARLASVRDGTALLQPDTGLLNASVSVGSACLIGLIFGFFPALRASQLSPVDAIARQ